MHEKRNVIAIDRATWRIYRVAIGSKEMTGDARLVSRKEDLGARKASFFSEISLTKIPGNESDDQVQRS